MELVEALVESLVITAVIVTVLWYLGFTKYISNLK